MSYHFENTLGKFAVAVGFDNAHIAWDFAHVDWEDDDQVDEFIDAAFH